MTFSGSLGSSNVGEDGTEEGTDSKAEGGILFLAKNSSLRLLLRRICDGDIFFFAFLMSSSVTLVSKENVNDDVFRRKEKVMLPLVSVWHRQIHCWARVASQVANIFTVYSGKWLV